MRTDDLSRVTLAHARKPTINRLILRVADCLTVDEREHSACNARYGDDMKLKDAADAMRSLLDAARPAVIAVYRPDGEVIVSPVWYRVNEEMFEVVMAVTDRKLEHLRADPRCVLLIFE